MPALPVHVRFTHAGGVQLVRAHSLWVIEVWRSGVRVWEGVRPDMHSRRPIRRRLCMHTPVFRVQVWLAGAPSWDL